jgi:hypothetical protein
MTVNVNVYSNNATSLCVTSQAPVASKDDVHPTLRAAEQVVDGRYGDGEFVARSSAATLAELTDGQADAFAQLDVEPNGTKSILVRMHELPLQVVQEIVRTPLVSRFHLLHA